MIARRLLRAGLPMGMIILLFVMGTKMNVSGQEKNPIESEKPKGIFFNGPVEVVYDTKGKELEPIGNHHWIDIDLSNQTMTAYSGSEIKRTFVVSTGTRFTPTVIGQYRVYEKHLEASMSGPGYFVPRVKYIQYFYKGYGIHAADWHDKFGTATSHGCVQLTEDEAFWLYTWSSIGSLVNVHY
jgi:lipoprotein-anchoring transpeptidase ErfK/SrfK